MLTLIDAMETVISLRNMFSSTEGQLKNIFQYCQLKVSCGSITPIKRVLVSCKEREYKETGIRYCTICHTLYCVSQC